MKCKGMIILILTIFVLISMAGVCASEVNETAIAGGDTTEMELSSNDEMGTDDLQTIENDDSLMQANDEEPVIRTDNGTSQALQDGLSEGEGTYSDLKREIGDGGNISLSKSYYRFDSDATIVIRNPGVINGNGAIVDMSGSYIRAFYVNTSGVTINNLTIMNVNYNNYNNGGAIFFNGDGAVTNCNFTGNDALSNGCAIYFRGNGTVEYCNFVNNTAGYSGGAVYFEGSGTVEHCNFVNNHANFFYAGAVYFGGDGAVEYCNFVNNTAIYYYGAAVYFSGDGAVEHCNFTGNVAYSTGAILFEGNGTAEHCNFVNNTATGGSGGAIYFSGEGTVENCNFTDNTAIKGGGGAICFNVNAIVENCNFVNNTSILHNGGAVFFGGDSAVENCNFTDNNAISYGGAIYVYQDSSSNVTNCNFNNNSAGVAGAIYFNGGDSRVFDCTFVSNSAGNYSAVHLSFGENFLSRCIFVNNTAVNGVVGDAWESHRNLEISNSIFLNNEVEMNVVDFADFENVCVDYNWFGNVVDDYDGGVPSPSSNVWLFLNVTANPDTIPIFGSSDITFMLRAYNKTAISAFDYDNSLLKPINLTISQTKGEVNSDRAILGESVQYTATDDGIGSVTAAIENVALTVELNIKANPGLSAEGGVITYGENATITLDYNSTATGKVNVTLTGKKHKETYGNLDLNTTLVLPKDIPADEYDVVVAYSGDEIFSNATANAALTINKANSTLTVGNIAFDYNGKGSTKASFSNATGITAKVVNNPKAVVSVKNNVIAVSGLDAGTYTLRVTTLTDDNHKAVTKTSKITVRKLKTSLTGKAVATTYNVNKDLVITLKDSKGNPLKGVQVSIYLNGAKKLKTNSKGQVKVSTKGLAPKVYTAKATFSGNANYVKSTKSVKVTVKKATPRMVAKAKTYTANIKTKIFSIVLKDSAGKAIKKAALSLKVGGKVYKVTTDGNGKATFKITQLTKKGTYVGVITYNGDKYYNKLNKNVKITVKPAPDVKPAFKTVSEGSGDVDMVMKIQRALKDKGYYLTYDGYYLMVDGDYGSCTARSVGEFQQDNGLPVTGQVDEATAKKLGII